MGCYFLTDYGFIIMLLHTYPQMRVLVSDGDDDGVDGMTFCVCFKVLSNPLL